MSPNVPIFAFQPNLAGVLSLVATVVLPLLVGLVTRSRTSAHVKAVLLLVLSALLTVVEAWQLSVDKHAPFHWQQFVINLIVSFVIAVAVHFGLWKPTGAAGATQRVGPQ
jgi:uncharacterized membrane protein